MLTLEIRNILKVQKTMNISELAHELKVDIFLLREIMEFWIKKGKVKKIKAESICCANGKGCNNCSLLSFELYSWID